MRHRWAIAAACAAALVAPSSAQMHAGGARGGGAGGQASFSSASAGGFRGSSSLGVVSRGSVSASTGSHQTMHSGGSFPGFNRSGFHQPGIHQPGFRQPFLGPRHFRNRFFLSTVYPCCFGYYGYSGYDSGYDYAAASYYPGYDYYASANYAQNDIAQQQQDIDRLEDEVASLREQRESGGLAAAKAPDRVEPATPTLLVFRDKHTQEVGNYAIVGGTLWIFNEQRATKLPLSWLDLDATGKANEERGVDFQIPR